MKKTLLAVIALMGGVMLHGQGVYQMWGMTQYPGSKSGALFNLDANGNNYREDYAFNLTNQGAAPIFTKLSLYNGKFYGVTSEGGAYNMGVIFQWDPLSNSYINKFDFNDDSGIQPSGSLTLFNDKFYGMAFGGGANGKGTIFEWDPTTNVYTKKFDFDGINGRNPQSDLYELNGKLYGITLGGIYDKGIILEWDPTLNVFTKEYDFKSRNEGYPNGYLTVYNAKLYGTSDDSNPDGFIFEFDPILKQLNPKLYFSKNDGSNPKGKLTVVNGKFYGCTSNGGLNNSGVIYEWNPKDNSYVKRYDFLGDGPYYERSGLTFIDSAFYGIASFDGISYWLYSWDYLTNSITNRMHFDWLNGDEPKGDLAVFEEKLYGLTKHGGLSDDGVIFQFDPKNNSYTKKVDFNLPGLNGANPLGSVTPYNGKLYGFTGTGGNGYGVLFEFDPIAKKYTKKIDFDGITSNYNTNSLSLWKNKFYGITNLLHSNSLIFEWDPKTNIYTKKVAINGEEGFNAFGSLTLFQDKFYGMTREGGSGHGVIFEYNPGTNKFTKKIDLSSNTGSAPVADLVLYQNKFYGTTLSGGKNNGGTIFEWDPVTNILTKKIDFDSPYYPYGHGHISYGSLTPFNNRFYGTTSQGGKYDRGVIFEWDPATNTYTDRFDFSALTGDYPDITLVASNTRLYGFTHWDASNTNGGAIFEWDPVSNIFSKKHDFDSYWGISNIFGLTLTSAKAPVSPGLANSCKTFPSITIDATNNNQWVPIIDDENNAVAEIKANGNNLGIVTTSMFINGGAIRKDKNNKYYLDRNITITPQVQPKTPVNVRLYIKATEYEALKNAANVKGKPNAIDSISDVKIYPVNSKCSPTVTTLGSAVGTVAEKWESDYVLSASVSTLSSFFFSAKTSCAPPTISNMLISTDTLWPPLHSLRGISVAYKTSGDCKCDPVTRWLTVKSNEPICGTGTADKSPDWVIVDANHVYLRAERSDRGTGRIYTITINAQNTAGAVSTYDFTVAVPLTMPAAKAAAIAAKDAVNGTSIINETMLDCIAVPNPSSDYFTLQILSSSNEKIEMAILDMSGRIIEKQNTYQNKIIRIGEKLKPGVYMIQLIQGDQQKTIKLVKQ